MKKDSYHIIGVMSGTSLDGVDLCYVNFRLKKNWDYNILNTITYNYSEEWKNRLLNATNLDKSNLAKLDIEYTNLLISLIKEFILKFRIDQVDAISSHGHTVFHEPNKGLTFQIGNLPELAIGLNLMVVCNFRIQDVEFGGQGAPLVPIGDKLLFPKYDYCLNLGGFSNISYKNKDEIKAFDVCPVNCVLNHYCNIIGLDYDNEGLIAESGKIDLKLLNELNSIEYYKSNMPKSLGIEWVTEIIFNKINQNNLSTADILRTYCEHISIQIANAIKNDSSSIFITGGGAKNKFLIKLIKDKINNPIIIPDSEIVDFKEALIFGFLGVLKLRGETNCLKSVTGADSDHSSGVIYK